jgi:hypothetical protein
MLPFLDLLGLSWVWILPLSLLFPFLILPTTLQLLDIQLTCLFIGLFVLVGLPVWLVMVLKLVSLVLVVCWLARLPKSA